MTDPTEASLHGPLIVHGSQFTCPMCYVSIPGNEIHQCRIGPGKCLSGREMEVSRLVREGRTTHEIAAELGLSWHTIRQYRKTAAIKMRGYARSQGDVPPAEA